MSFSGSDPVYPGLPIMTPDGAGVVLSVRHDGMVVTKLPTVGEGSGDRSPASSYGAGPSGPFFIGFFHPSVVKVLSTGPSIATTPSSPVGLFEGGCPSTPGLGLQVSLARSDDGVSRGRAWV